MFSLTRRLRALLLSSEKSESLGVGLMGLQRDGSGKPYVLPTVKKAEKILAEAMQDKEYLPITGLADFTKLAAELAYGKDSKPLVENRVRLLFPELEK